MYLKVFVDESLRLLVDVLRVVFCRSGRGGQTFVSLASSVAATTPVAIPARLTALVTRSDRRRAITAVARRQMPASKSDAAA